MMDIFGLRRNNGGSGTRDEGSLFCFWIGRERTNSSAPAQPVGVHCQQVVFGLDFIHVSTRNEMKSIPL